VRIGQDDARGSSINDVENWLRLEAVRHTGVEQVFTYEDVPHLVSHTRAAARHAGCRGLRFGRCASGRLREWHALRAASRTQPVAHACAPRRAAG